MSHPRLWSAGLFFTFVILISSCASPVSSPTTEVVGPTPTPRVVEITATPEPTATEKPKNSVQATMDALTAQITLVPPTRGPEPDDYVGMLEQAWNLINENYVRDNFNGIDWPAVLEKYRPIAEKITDQEAFWDMMEDFVAELDDDHSRFVRPDRFASEFGLPSSGTGSPWTGLIVWPAREDEHFYIWYVCELGPAASAGLRRGDIITAIDGEPVEPINGEYQRADRMRAYFGDGDSNRVVLTVLQGPGTEPRDVSLRLGGASGCDGWRVEVISQNPYIGYIRVPAFEGDSDTNILDAIEALEENQPLDGLILDIRHNPGGNADRDLAIFTQGTFGTRGPLREGKSRAIWRIRGPVKWNETTPLVVLTDGSTHSAGEYFATAIKQSGRATLVGMPTAGNTEGISGFALPDGSIIRIAVQAVELPDGSSLEGVGVQPDVRVSLGMWGLRQDPDIQLQTGIDVLLDQIQ